MVRFAVGYRSRAFVTFGRPIPLDGFDPDVAARRCSIWRTWCARRSAGSTRCCRRRCVAAAMRPSITRADLDRPHRRDARHAAGDRRQPGGDERPTRRSRRPPSRSRHAASSSIEDGRFRVRERNVLRYYAPIDPAPARRPPARPTDARRSIEGIFPRPRASHDSATAGFALRDGAGAGLRAALHRRRDRSRKRSPRSRRSPARPAADARLSRRERRDRRRGRRRRRATTCSILDAIVALGHRAQHLAEADAARTRRRSRHLRRQPAPHPRAGRPSTGSSCASTWRTRRTPTSRCRSSRRCGGRATATSASCSSRT